ncbi:MAG: DUF362 domain-containing protein [Candidatus Helarchaeota archaeon]|nr:DUF362 domain-containing protein [Candidatus Helarchaeota archaeon]
MMKLFNRRTFIKRTALGLFSSTGGVGYLEHLSKLTNNPIIKTINEKSKVAIIRGEERADNVIEALKIFENDIKRRIENKKVIIKPNFVSTRRQLSATNVENIEGILDFFKPIYKERIIIAESPAIGNVEEGYQNYDYNRLTRKYNVELKDIDREDSDIVYIIDRNIHPLPIRVSKMLLDDDSYIISPAILKTHDAVVVTLSLKNIVMGAPLISDRNYKSMVHQGIKGTNYNLFLLAQKMPPDLAIIDGVEGMEGNGPVSGKPVKVGVTIASTDFLAADRVAVEVMKVDFNKIGYLNYCATAKMGNADIDNIEIIGEKIENCAKKFKLHYNVESQLKW